MKKIIYGFFAVISIGIFLFQSDIDLTSMTTVDIPEENGNISVVFCPGEVCQEAFVREIRPADSSVHCAFFDLDLPPLISLIEQKSQELEVKLVIDHNNYADELNKPYVVWDNNNQYSHNKFCIIDGQKVLTGSTNPTENGVFKNNNNLLVINSRFLAKNYENEFQELYNKEFGKGQKNKYPLIIFNNYELENYFCPEDMCKDNIVSELEKAKESIYFMTFSFTHPEISGAILAKKDLDVRGIFERRQNSRYSQINVLNETFGTMKWDKNSATMHHKVFIIDNKTVITGSMNPSKNGDTNNDENILIIRQPEIVEKFVKEFEKLFD